jgi:hypothetical protein
MKRALRMIAVLLLAVPLSAQDIDLGLGGDVGGLLNIPAPRGNTPPARGAAPANRAAAPGPARGAAPNAVPVDRLVRVREILAGSNAPLSQQQEASLNALLSREIPAMRQALQQRVAAGQHATPPVMPSMEELEPEIIRLNDQLLGKVVTAPSLTPDQQGVLKKMYKDQVKSRGGFDAIRVTLEDAGAAFSAEQTAQIQPLFDEQNKARVELIRQSQGQPPEKAKLDQLQRETLAKVLKLLTPPQRTALLAK